MYTMSWLTDFSATNDANHMNRFNPVISPTLSVCMNVRRETEHLLVGSAFPWFCVCVYVTLGCLCSRKYPARMPPPPPHCQLAADRFFIFTPWYDQLSPLPSFVLLLCLLHTILNMFWIANKQRCKRKSRLHFGVSSIPISLTFR